MSVSWGQREEEDGSVRLTRTSVIEEQKPASIYAFWTGLIVETSLNFLTLNMRPSALHVPSLTMTDQQMLQSTAHGLDSPIRGWLNSRQRQHLHKYAGQTRD